MPVSSLSLEQVNEICSKERYAGIVYCYTNQSNGKRYVGQTKNPMDRHKTHLCSSKPHSRRCDANVPFHRAIQKYGIDKFLYAVLEVIIADSKPSLTESLDIFERQWISYYNTSDDKYGYNILNGGVAGERKGTHRFACPVIQYSIDGEKIAEFDCMNEAIQKTGAKNLACAFNRGKKYANGFVWVRKGEPYPQEEFDRWQKRKIYQYSIEGDFLCTHKSLKDAANAVNGDKTRILLCAKPPYINISYGYRWANTQVAHLPFPPAHLFVEVHQYDSNGNYVASYSNIVEAAKAIGMKSGSHISACLEEHWRKAKGFYFRKYKTERITIQKHGRIKTSRTSGN